MISLRILPPQDSDTMTRSAAARPEPRVDEWKPNHETPSILSFTAMEERKASPEYQREHSELLSRKFREAFP